jgi:hypothetical protein
MSFGQPPKGRGKMIDRKKGSNQKEIFHEKFFDQPSVCKMPLFSVVVDTVFTYIDVGVGGGKAQENISPFIDIILTSLDENCLLSCVPSSTGFRKI